LPKPSSNEAVVWGLAAYPISTAFRRRVEEAVAAKLDVAVLAELRSAGLVDVVRHLLGVRRPRAVVLVEDELSGPVVPVLRFLLSLTQCRVLSTAMPDGRLAPFGRITGLLDGARLVAGSVSGVLAALRAAIELAWLRRQAPQRRRMKTIRRIAYLKTNLWFGVKAGGSVGHVAGVANAMARRFEAVDLLAVECPPLLDPTVRHHSVDNAGAFGYPYELNYYRYESAFSRRARRVFSRQSPDAVYQRMSLANYSGVRLARRLGIPLIIEFNGSEVWVSKHWGRPLLLPGIAEAAEDVSLHHADLIVTVSQVLGDQLEAKGIPKERILVHPNCVDPRQFDPSAFSALDRAALRREHGIAENSVVCGFIGTFGAWHGVTVLADTIRRMALEDEAWLRQWNAHFLIVGDGMFMPKVRETLSGDGVARFVTLTGLVPQDRAARYLAASDVLLSPHVRNPDGTPFFGSPTKLFEYMAMAKGIVASDLEQIGDVLRRSYRASVLPGGRCGEDDEHLAVLMEPGSSEELAQGIKFLVERPDYRSILGRNAREEVLRRYTWDRNVDELLAKLAAVAELRE
jgi:glycosyltransferase involved in cell wall biosynthesis